MQYNTIWYNNSVPHHNLIKQSKGQVYKLAMSEGEETQKNKQELNIFL